MEKELFDVLGMLDGKQTLAENLARLDKEHDVQLAPELLEYLYTHGVVVAPEPAKPELPPKPPVDLHAGALPVKERRQDRRARAKKKKS
jgi:hypothetical protein